MSKAELTEWHAWLIAVLVLVYSGMIMVAVFSCSKAHAQDVPDGIVKKSWSVGPDVTISGIEFAKSETKGVFSGKLQAAAGGSIMFRWKYKGQEVLGIGPAMYLKHGDTESDVNLFPAVNISLFKWVTFGVSMSGSTFLGGNVLSISK